MAKLQKGSLFLRRGGAPEMMADAAWLVEVDHIASRNGWFVPVTATLWTVEENWVFERALAQLDLAQPDCWEKVAELLPRRTVDSVINYFCSVFLEPRPVLHHPCKYPQIIFPLLFLLSFHSIRYIFFSHLELCL